MKMRALYHELLCGSLWSAPGRRTRVALSSVVSLALAACSGGVLSGPEGPGERPAAGASGHTDGAGGPGQGHLFQAEPGALRRLTVLQYRNSVRDLFDVDLQASPGAPPIVLPDALEADTAVNGFYAIGAAKATISPFAAEKFEAAAYALAAQALVPTRRTAFVGCTPASTTDETCTREAVARFGGKAFRRPLSSEELTRYAAVAKQAQEALGDFYEGLEFAIAGLLQSPHFLFRVELGDTTVSSALRPYTDYEMASRLSYMLWGSTPDEELLAAASRGELITREGLREQAERMLAADRMKPALDAFHTERLSLDALLTLEKDDVVYAGLDDGLRDAMLHDVLASIEELTFGAETDFRRLFDGRVGFVDAKLADIYGLPGVDTMTRVELPASSGRVGLLGKAAFLASNAHANTTSPTLRGKYIRERLLCQSIPAPPPEVVTVLPEPNPDAPTMRERLKAHAENASCNTCHKLMDPLGLPLEHFDAVGRYRASDNGHPLDVTGSLDGQAFTGAAELAVLLRDDPRTSACVARQLYRYAVAHVETTGEQPAIDALIADFAANGYSFTALLRAVVMSDGFRYAGEE